MQRDKLQVQLVPRCVGVRPRESSLCRTDDRRRQRQRSVETPTDGRRAKQRYLHAFGFG
jgi:hypothetical protein